MRIIPTKKELSRTLRAIAGSFAIAISIFWLSIIDWRMYDEQFGGIVVIQALATICILVFGIGMLPVFDRKKPDEHASPMREAGTYAFAIAYTIVAIPTFFLGIVIAAAFFGLAAQDPGKWSEFGATIVDHPFVTAMITGYYVVMIAIAVYIVRWSTLATRDTFAHASPFKQTLILWGSIKTILGFVGVAAVGGAMFFCVYASISDPVTRCEKMKMEDEHFADMCWTELALKRNDATFCGRIMNAAIRDACVDDVRKTRSVEKH